MQSALIRLKNAVIQVTQNKFFDAQADTRITCDASKEGLGAVLEQRQHCSWVPIAFASRFLNAAESHYSVNELELLAVVWSVEHFKNYVFGRHFTIRTDHRALLSALKSNRRNKTTFSRLTRWVDRLLPYSFEIVHVPGRDMGFADYLSRCPSGLSPPVSPFDQHFSVVACHRAVGPLFTQSNSALKQLNQSDSPTSPPHNFDRSLHARVSRSTAQPVNCFRSHASHTLPHFTSVYSSLNSLSLQMAERVSTPSPTPSTIISDVEGCFYSEVPDSFVTAPVPSAASSTSSVMCINPQAATQTLPTPPTIPSTRELRHAGPLMANQFSAEMIRELTRTDKTLQTVITALHGSENQRKRVAVYWADLWKDLHVSNGCLFLDDKVVLPELLRQPFLQLLHSTHAGARAMKSRCEHVWFPNMYKTIQATAKQCFQCTSIGKNLACPSHLTGPSPRAPATRVLDELELDFLGPIYANPPSSQYVLVAVDRFSRFPFAMCCSSPSAETVLKFLSEFTLLFGLPRRIRSDQGSAFTSDLISQWSQINNVGHIFSPIGDHRGSGQVERLIRTLRTRLGACRANRASSWSFPKALFAILQDLRFSIHATTDVSPFSLFFSRPPHTPFSNLVHNSISDPSRIVQKGFYRNGRDSPSVHPRRTVGHGRRELAPNANRMPLASCCRSHGVIR